MTGIFNLVRPGGTIVLVGIPVDPVALDVAAACSREVRIETVFRYANIFDRALEHDRIRQSRLEAADHRGLWVRGQYQGL